MPKLIIESAEEKTSQKGKKYWIVSVSGKKAVCFSERTPSLIGQEVEATIEESTDDMGNTRRFLKLSGETFKKPYGKSPEERDEIMKMALLNTAVKFWGEGQAKCVDDVIVTAKEFYHAVKETW